MNCREIEEKLHLLADPAVPAALRDAAQAHISGCARCRRLVALAVGEGEEAAGGERELPGGVPEDLIAEVLRKTTGAPSVCDRVTDRLCAWVDGGLSGVDSDLIAGHVAHCPECGDVVAVLRALSAELPLMCEVEPDVWFVVDVLERTSRRKIEGFDPVALLGRTWERLIRRPRIAQEIAYCAAMILFLVFGTHPRDTAPLRNEGAAISTRAADDFTRGVDLLSGFVVHAGEDLTSGHCPAIPPEAHSVLAGIRRTRVRIATTLGLSWSCGRQVGDALLHWDTIAIWSAVRELREGFHRCWREKNLKTEPSNITARIPRQMMQSTASNGGAAPDGGDGIARRGVSNDDQRGIDTGEDREHGRDGGRSNGKLE
jgi:hypothetical protein